MRNWKDDLSAFDPDDIDITHNMTPRYFRALNKRRWIINNFQILGWKNGMREQCYEIAVWMSHPQGTKKCGYYVAMRVFYSKNVLDAVEIYAFYDGKDKSVCIKSLYQAIVYSKKWGFHD